MTKKYSIKKALLSTIVAIFLCFSMLVGTTFAWFTDSVTSSGNKIVAGTLKVDLELLEDDGSWTSIKDTGKAIFDYDNWEPGYTEVEVLKVANEGSLSLKWQATIVADNDKALTSLASVIDVYVKMGATEKPQNRAELSTWDYAGTLDTFVNTMAETVKGELKAQESAYFGIAFKMQQTAGDEYQGMDLGSTFNVVVMATQLANESDSFGNDYDADLEMGTNGLSRTLSDGSTAFYYNEESGYAGRVRLLELPENMGNEYVVPAEINDLGGALAGVTLDKLTVPAGVDNAYKSLEDAKIDEVVIEDGATKVANRMFYKTNVKNVVIPSGVTVIEENAFAQTAGLENLVIPASVTTTEEAAFQHMTNLTTVTFEGNTAIQGYAFRGCAALTTVYLNGDDVTFIPSTLNGRNSTWFCNSESNNPNTSTITFHVQNETVAARVKTAMGAEANNTPVYIGETLYVTVKNATELQNAVNNATGETIIAFTADISGNVTVTQKAGVNLTINGNDFNYQGVMTTFGDGNQNSAETLTIKNIDFQAQAGADSCIYSPDRKENNKYSYSHNVTVENCTFTDADGVVNCAAIRHGDGGDKNWTVTGCTVDTTMHSLLQINNVAGNGIIIEKCKVYSKNGINLNQCEKVTVIGCEFDVKGYAIRFGASSGTVGAAETYLITGCTLKSACNDGDAVIILRATSDNATLTIENTAIVGTTEITNNATGVTIIR